MNMSRSFKLFGLLIAAGMLFASCSTDKGLTIEKRKYRGGYHVEWHGNKKHDKHVKQDQEQIRENMTMMDQMAPTQLTASTDQTVALQNAQELQSEVANSTKQTSTNSKYANVMSETSTMSKAEIKQLKKDIRKEIKQELKASAAAQDGASGLPMWLIAIFCIILPPLAVGLELGIGTPFWINILLTLLFWIPGIIHAFIVIF